MTELERKREGKDGRENRQGKGGRPDTGKGEIEEVRWEEDSQRRG